jgi:hypothetical protein
MSMEAPVIHKAKYWCVGLSGLCAPGSSLHRGLCGLPTTRLMTLNRFLI